MINIEQHHSEEHQHGIKDIQEYLMIQQIPILAHNVLNDSEDGTDHDQEAGAVENVEVALPWDSELLGTQGGHGAQAVVEDPSDEDKEAEEEDLDSQTASNNILAELDAVIAGGLG